MMRCSCRRVVIFAVCLYLVRLTVILFLSDDSSIEVQRREADTDRRAFSKKNVNSEDNLQSRAISFLGMKERNVQAKSRQSGRSYYIELNKPDDVLRMERPEYLRNFKNPCWYETTSGNSTLKCLPYFRVIGVDKCGTTDLWHRMSRHPEIVRPKAVMGKETHWWSWRRFGFDIWVRNKPILHFDWYLSHFDAPALKIETNVITRRNGSTFHPLVTGEGSPTEFWDFTGWNLIPQNVGKSPSEAIVTPNCLHHVTPGLKSIVIFRNPTDRAYSDYLFLDQFRRIANLSAAGFHRDVVTSIQMLDDCIKSHIQPFCLYDKDLHMKMPVRLIPGLYDMFLSKWQQVFPAEQILVLRNEDYSRDIKTHLNVVFKFLQLSPLSEEDLFRITTLPRVYERAARAKSVGPMSHETREMLDKFYKPFNQMLANRLNDSKYLWNS